jgi:hypothetical protein
MAATLLSKRHGTLLEEYLDLRSPGEVTKQLRDSSLLFTAEAIVAKSHLVISGEPSDQLKERYSGISSVGQKLAVQGDDRLVPEPEQEVARIIEEAVPWRAPVEAELVAATPNYIDL